MSNTIQIKRGPGKPANGKLAQGELGFDTTNGHLYIGNEGICQKIKAGSVDSVKEADLEFGGKHFANNFSPIDAALVPELGANRFAFIQQGVTVERKKGNNNWEDVTSNYPNEIKQIFSTTNGGILLRDGQVANDTPFSLRITIDTTAANIYTELHKFAIYVSTNSTRSCSCLISISRTGETWQTPGGATPFSITGWPGWNILNTALFLTKGYTAVSDRFQFIRFEFSGIEPANNSNTGLRIIGIMAFGGMGWATPSTMASTGRIYSFDYNKNVTFPAQVTASSFNGTATKAIEATNLTSTLLLDKGGTGSATGLHNATNGAVIVKNSGGYLAPVSSAKGAFYATAANGTPLFGTLPIAQGGTGATTAEAALKNLGGLPLSGGEISGNLKVKTLTITDQSAGGISHIKFSRETYNYIEVPSAARLIFLPQAKSSDPNYWDQNSGILTISSHGVTLSSKSYGTADPSGTPPNGTIYFKVVE